MAKDKMIQITQIRSAIGRPMRQKRTLQALGMGRLHQPRLHRVTPTILGMIRSVSHLIEVKEHK